MKDNSLFFNIDGKAKRRNPGKPERKDRAHCRMTGTWAEKEIFQKMEMEEKGKPNVSKKEIMLKNRDKERTASDGQTGIGKKSIGQLTQF